MYAECNWSDSIRKQLTILQYLKCYGTREQKEVQIVLSYYRKGRIYKENVERACLEVLEAGYH